MGIQMPPNQNGDDAEYIGGVIKRVSNFSMETLDDRKKFQKTVYLIQAFDIPLGYTFNWYLHGPYCPALADVGYEISSRYNEIQKARFQDRENEGRFQSFLDFISPIKEDVVRLEASASLHFIAERNPDADQDMVIQFILDEKDLGGSPNEFCEQEWARLKEYSVIG